MLFMVKSECALAAEASKEVPVLTSPAELSAVLASVIARSAAECAAAGAKSQAEKDAAEAAAAAKVQVEREAAEAASAAKVQSEKDAAESAAAAKVQAEGEAAEAAAAAKVQAEKEAAEAAAEPAELSAVLDQISRPLWQAYAADCRSRSRQRASEATLKTVQQEARDSAAKLEFMKVCLSKEPGGSTVLTMFNDFAANCF